MFVFDLKVGYSCNNQCAHCIIELNKNQLKQIKKPLDRTTSECMQEIDESYKMFENSAEKYHEIVITGGEATIRPDFINLCDYIMNKGINRIQLQTNGRKLSDMNFAKKLVSCYPIFFTIALHGPNSDIHDKVTRKAGSFDETVKGIENIVSLGGNIIGKIVLSKINFSYLKETVMLFESLGVKRINIAFPHSGIRDERFFNYVPTYKSIRDSVVETLNYAKEHFMDVDTETVPFCFLEGYEEFVAELRAKNYKMIGDPVNQPKFDWKKLRIEIKSKADICKECLMNMLCEGVWEEYISNYGQEEFVPLTDLKKFMSALTKIQTLQEARQCRK
ncbi:radical SAM protein [Ruminiclostridium herbifermentans]|uniref:Radical SAM protein n=1 Tax=Ruminiclostridium herbifermentans TaxID=2488810 RepID=A0A4U7JLQ4_9FIRM|nr:radical SAM protein [Ruminiclostridium herbifermentans]QNU66188.1 radical SAM protein [Ruminiclostridium herbifermentans]